MDFLTWGEVRFLKVPTVFTSSIVTNTVQRFGVSSNHSFNKHSQRALQTCVVATTALVGRRLLLYHYLHVVINDSCILLNQCGLSSRFATKLLRFQETILTRSFISSIKTRIGVVNRRVMSLNRKWLHTCLLNLRVTLDFIHFRHSTNYKSLCNFVSNSSLRTRFTKQGKLEWEQFQK